MRRGGSRRCRGAIVCQVRAHEVPRRERGQQRELPSHDRRGYDARQPLRVASRLCRVRTLHPKHLQNALLWREHGATADGAYLDAGHGHSHV